MMRKIIVGILASILLLSVAGCKKKEISGDLMITNVNIIDMVDGTVSSNMTIIFKDDIISEIGASDEFNIPKQMKVVNANGKFAIPGLWDMHAHTSSDFNTRNILYPTFISNGVTGIRVMSADCFEPCWELTLNIDQSRKIQHDINEKKLIGPRALLASTFIHGAKPGEPSTVQAPGTKEHGKELVHLLMERGVDFIKVYDELPREAYFGIAEEATKQGMPFAGHVPVSIKASEASDAGQKSIEHCCEGSLFEECSTQEEQLRKQIATLIQSREPKDMYKLVLELVKTYDEAKCQEVFRTFLENDTWYVPNLLAAETDQPIRAAWRTDERLKYIPRTEREWWPDDEMNTNTLFGPSYPEIRKKRFEIVQAMNKAGVNLLAGSDCGIYGVFYGSGLHDELALLVEAGLTELEALQTATINAATYADRADSLGNIKKGMLADLILLEANPLDNIKNTQRISAVMAQGDYFERAALDSILKKVEIEAAK